MQQLTPDLLLRAYACGIFPMAECHDSQDLYWLDPKQRGVLPFDQFHLPRRLRRVVKSDLFEVRVDTAFDAVMNGCARLGNGRTETWINDSIKQLYSRLAKMGHAHSIECWQDDKLVGGLYGVRLGGAFFGESMFHHVTNASKVALVHLVARLEAGGFSLLDTQFVTNHLSQFGAIEISRDAYHEALTKALGQNGDFYKLPVSVSGDEVLQAITHTS